MFILVFLFRTEGQCVVFDGLAPASTTWLTAYTFNNLSIHLHSREISRETSRQNSPAVGIPIYQWCLRLGPGSTKWVKIWITNYPHRNCASLLVGFHDEKSKWPQGKKSWKFQTPSPLGNPNSPHPSTPSTPSVCCCFLATSSSHSNLNVGFMMNASMSTKLMNKFQRSSSGRNEDARKKERKKKQEERQAPLGFDPISEWYRYFLRVMGAKSA